MKRPLALLGLLAATLLIAVLLVPPLIPESYLKRQLGSLLAHETGLRIEEARRLRLSLFPHLGISLEGVAVRPPASFGRAPLIRADEIFAAIKPSSLFARRIALSRLVIENPSIAFRIDASGLRNWDLTEARTGSRGVRLAALADTPLAIKASLGDDDRGARPAGFPSIDIDIVNGSFGYRDEVRQRELKLEDVNIRLRGGPGGAMTLEGGLRAQGDPVRINAVATPAGQPSDRAASLRVALRSQAAESDLDGLLMWDGSPQFSGEARLDVNPAWLLARLDGSAPPAEADAGRVRVEGRLELSQEQLILADATVAAPGAQGRLSLTADFGGLTRAAIDDLALHGGIAKARLTLDASKPDAILSASLDMSGVDPLSLTRSFSGFDWISGRAEARIEVAGGGRSWKDMARTLTGTGRISVSDGAIEGLDLPLIVAETRKGALRRWAREAGRRTPFDRMEASFVIENGVARTGDLSLSGPDIAANGEGKTDFVRERLDYRLTARIDAKAGAASETAPSKEDEETASLVIPLVVKGDWDRPNIYPDIESAIKDSDSLLGTAKLFGKSIETLTDGQIKADDFGEALDSLFGKKKKKPEEPAAR